MNSKKILIIQLRRVGDVVFTLPVIGALRKNFPDAQIDFLVERPSDQLVGLHPDLNELLVYDKSRPIFWIREVRRRSYDWILDFHSNGRTLLLTLFTGAALKAGFSGPLTRTLVYNRRAEVNDKKYIVEQKLDLLRKLDLSADKWSWGIKIPELEMKWAEDFLKSANVKNGDKLVGIAPATRRATRAWISERFAEVVYALASRSIKVLFLWGPGERSVVEEIVKYKYRKDNLTGSAGGENGKIIVPPETSLLQLSALIQKCNLIVAVDNGPKNIAVALGIPTITISGPTNPLSFNPHGDASHVVIRDDKLFCVSCGLNRCPYHHECMQNVSAEQVIQKIEATLNIASAFVPSSFERIKTAIG